MNENIGRKALFVAGLLVFMTAWIVAPLLVGNRPFRLGLDLQGGTRLVYRFDFEKAKADGQITAQEASDPTELLRKTIDVIKRRVDPNGVREVAIRPEGTDRIVVELPGAAEQAVTQVFGKLETEIAADAPSLSLVGTDPASLKQFPASGGLLRIGDEKVSYKGRSAFLLTGLARAVENTTASAHAAGTSVELLTNDEIQRAIENVGEMKFFLGADASDVQQAGGDLAAETNKMQEWRKANPGEPIETYNSLAADKGGPHPRLRWYPRELAENQIEVPIEQRPAVPLLIPKSPKPDAAEDEWIFTGDGATFGASMDPELGYPCIQFEMPQGKKLAFGDFTEANIRKGMAIVLNSEIITLATINGKLPGGGIITGGPGGFKQREVDAMVRVLRSGSLKIKPELRSKARVGASLGDDYIRASWYSAIVALGVVVLFMVYVYGTLGVFSIIGLVANLLLLLGAMALAKATITLPGIAGMVLTVGMAVDGNILIYERLREERARGLKLVQAAKAAFEKAGVTIIDSNVTTLLAGLILLWLGSGPIKGFATTLCVGIVTTLITVIFVTEILIFWDIKRGRTEYPMREFVKGTTIDFLSYTKAAVGISAVLMIGGLGLFFYLPAKDKLGLDFTGGFTATVRTQEPQKIERIRELVGKIQGTIGSSSQVVPMLDSGDANKGYSEFRITSKLEDQPGSAATDEKGIESAENEIRTALKSLLQKGPVELASAPSDADAAITGELYLEEGHKTDDIVGRLKDAGLKDPSITALPGIEFSYSFKGAAAKDASPETLKSKVAESFIAHRDTTGVAYKLRSPIPESAVVGSQVGSEMRDKAIRALVLGLFATVLYLRVRFVEWSFGIAVVVSLLHDILITLGALAVANLTGLVQAEIDLTMIAAFLTIIGYSQNDTIVIFDRIRENIPRSKKPLREIINDSVNQTLGRTILTTATVWLCVVVLFAFSVGSRNSVEAFSFAMIIGVTTGCFSTVYIASPVFLWLENRSARKADMDKTHSPQA